MTAPNTPPREAKVVKVLLGIGVSAFGIWLIVAERHTLTTAILVGGLAVYGLGMFILIPAEVSAFFGAASAAVASIFRAKHGEEK